MVRFILGVVAAIGSVSVAGAGTAVGAAPDLRAERANAPHGFTVDWAATLHGRSIDSRAVARAGDGGLFIVAQGYAGGRSRPSLTKVDATGRVSWRSPVAVSDAAGAAVSGDVLYIVGNRWIRVGNGSDAYPVVAAFDQNGNRLWTTRLDRRRVERHRLGVGAPIADGAGGVYLSGTLYRDYRDSASLDTGVVYRVSAAGAVVVHAELRASNRPIRLGVIAPSSAGVGLFVGGRSPSADYYPHPSESGHADMFVAALNGEGKERWRRTLRGERFRDGGFEAGVAGLLPTPSGGVLMGGSAGHGYDTTPQQHPFQQVLAEYDVNGRLIWAKTFGQPGPDHTAGMVEFGGTRYALTNHLDDDGPDALLREADRRGIVAWAAGGALYEVSAQDVAEAGHGIVVLLDRRVDDATSRGSVVLMKLVPSNE